MTVEVVSFKLAPGTDPATFRRAAVQAHPHASAFDGFVRRELLHDPETGEWVDTIHWDSRDHALAAAEVPPQIEAVLPFMSMIDLNSAKMLHLEPVALSPTEA